MTYYRYHVELSHFFQFPWQPPCWHLYFNGNVSNNLDTVLNKWKTEHEALFTFNMFNTEPGSFDDGFYEECVRIENAKLNKSIGIDNLPYKMFKNGKSTQVLTKLFNKMYDTSIIPTTWRLAIIKPLPNNNGPCLPLQYRGISLLSTVYKLYASILNNRIVMWQRTIGVL